MLLSHMNRSADGPAAKPRPSRLVSQVQRAGVWLLGRVARVWPFILFAVIFGFSWDALRQINTRAFRTAFHGLAPSWIIAATLITIANIAVMGLYDVIAFRRTRTRWLERWRYGSVAFAWSNFLTLGPLAGPAIRLWLYRPAVDQPSDLQGGVVSIAIAFMAGLAGWMAAALVGRALGFGVMMFALVAFAFVLAGVWIARTIATRLTRFASPAVTASSF